MSDEENNDEVLDYQDKIVHVLSIYPIISSTMLQMGLGPGISPKHWRPSLQHLIDEGKVISDSVSKMSPAGRYHQYQRLQLAPELLAAEQAKFEG